ncbi:MAG TPA: pyridoxamine 5'-phosphate oxidase family protein [Candidatus Sulfotelmatobacter sp.]|nr:pyridoxamine 5'-phosphate oxidase family protein [Candidatus Sulfotelmatobacter sp.]
MSLGTVRRTDLALDRADAEAALAGIRVAYFATADGDGEPYVMPCLFVWADGLLQFHTTRAVGHFARNLAHRPRLCFAAAEMGEVYPYGGFACDATTSYVSVIGVGPVRVEAASDDKARFFDRFLAKYADPGWNHPAGFYPRLDDVTVYAIEPETLTGKRIPLPPLGERWPAQNRTRSPGARLQDR